MKHDRFLGTILDTKQLPSRHPAIQFRRTSQEFVQLGSFSKFFFLSCSNLKFIKPTTAHNHSTCVTRAKHSKTELLCRKYDCEQDLLTWRGLHYPNWAVLALKQSYQAPKLDNAGREPANNFNIIKYLPRLPGWEQVVRRKINSKLWGPRGKCVCYFSSRLSIWSVILFWWNVFTSSYIFLIVGVESVVCDTC